MRCEQRCSSGPAPLLFVLTERLAGTAGDARHRWDSGRGVPYRGSLYATFLTPGLVSWRWEVAVSTSVMVIQTPSWAEMWTRA